MRSQWIMIFCCVALLMLCVPIAVLAQEEPPPDPPPTDPPPEDEPCPCEECEECQDCSGDPVFIQPDGRSAHSWLLAVARRADESETRGTSRVAYGTFRVLRRSEAVEIVGGARLRCFYCPGHGSTPCPADWDDCPRASVWFCDQAWNDCGECTGRTSPDYATCQVGGLCCNSAAGAACGDLRTGRCSTFGTPIACMCMPRVGAVWTYPGPCALACR